MREEKKGDMNKLSVKSFVGVLVAKVNYPLFLYQTQVTKPFRELPKTLQKNATKMKKKLTSNQNQKFCRQIKSHNVALDQFIVASRDGNSRANRKTIYHLMCHN
jgi:hypothetical protein